MEETKQSKAINTLIILGFLFYFLILLVERVLALIFSIDQGGLLALKEGTFLGIATYSLTALSVLGGTFLFVKSFLKIFPKLFSKDIFPLEDEYPHLVLASMVLLLGGMMHTGWTLAPIQFVSYGFLILSMIVVCTDFCLKDKANRFFYIVSLIYLILFSMAIPVVYSIADNGAIGVIFYIGEFAAVFLLLPFFGIALNALFLKGRVGFCPWMVIVMAVLDGVIIGLKWNEEINFFLLIFASLTLLFYLTFGLIARKKQSK